MCFAISIPPFKNLPAGIDRDLSFSFIVPPPLKIESSVYDYLKDFNDVSLLPVLTVSFLSNLTSVSSTLDSAIGLNILKTMEYLSSYPVYLFDDFFWSSLSTDKHFRDLNSSSDNDMAKLWRHLKDVFKNVNSSSLSLDPCQFKLMKTELHSVITINFD